MSFIRCFERFKAGLGPSPAPFGVIWVLRVVRLGFIRVIRVLHIHKHTHKHKTHTIVVFLHFLGMFQKSLLRCFDWFRAEFEPFSAPNTLF